MFEEILHRTGFKLQISYFRLMLAAQPNLRLYDDAHVSSTYLLHAQRDQCDKIRRFFGLWATF